MRNSARKKRRMSDREPTAAAKEKARDTKAKCDHAPYLPPFACDCCFALALDDFGAQAVKEKGEQVELLATAHVRIAMVCCMSAYAADKEFWCKPEQGRHSLYCAEGMARRALGKVGWPQPPDGAHREH